MKTGKLLLIIATVVIVGSVIRNRRDIHPDSAGLMPANAVKTREIFAERGDEQPLAAVPAAPVITVVAKGPFTDLVRRWKAEGNKDVRDSLQAEIEGWLSAETSPALVALLAPDFSATSLGLKALGRWAESDPVAALRWVENDPSHDRDQIAAVVDAILGRDGAELNAQLDALPAGEWKTALLESAVSCSLRRDNPAQAASWLAKIPQDRRSAEMMESIASAWGKNDFSGAIAWVMSQDEPGQQDRLLSAMLGGYALINPAGAAHFARSVFESGELLHRTMELIVPAWSARDAHAAAEWIEKLPEVETKRQALDTLLPVWLATDKSAARNWVLSQSDRGESVARVSQWAAQNDPELAVELLQRVAPTEMRDSMRAGILRQWARWDFDKANAWAGQLPAGPLRTEAMVALHAVASEPQGLPY